MGGGEVGAKGRVRRAARIRTRRPVAVPVAALLLLFAACRQDMHDTPRYEALEASGFFADGMSARPLVDGTIARGGLRTDALLHTGKTGGELSNRLPFPADRALLDRGRERYDIYCAPCHDRTGSGEGMVVRRGFRRPPSFHEPRLREAPIGHFFDVMSNGFGVMQDYASQVPVADRWAIAAYVRALQLSQNAKLAELPTDIRSRFKTGSDR